jgi:hypothetical protein
MLTKAFKMNGTDFSAYAYKGGLSTSYDPVAGLPTEYTMDGTEHDDVIRNKATYIVRLNPLPDAAIAQQIVTLYRQPKVFLTVYDMSLGANVTKFCRTGSVKSDPALVKQGNITYWQVSDLVFREV